mmetsp:Transcript_4665/g.13029  ORF Transcript_4665/g.13029 Transcript_4665/m.13029 type:complete len:298 (+) Transcript_4665:120-1013(+)
MEPMPMPTRNPSTPQSMRCFACRRVTTLPPTTCRSGNCDFIQRMISCWNVLSPWLLSTTIASTPAATRACTRSRSPGRVPTAAATRRLPLASLVAKGNSACFMMSVRATSATIRPPFVTIGSFPNLESAKIWLAVGKSTPSSATVTWANFFITMFTIVDPRSSTKSVSRRVISPSSREPMWPSSVTGKPVKPQRRRRSSNSTRFIVGLMQIGSRMKPLLYFFTFMTSFACASMLMLLWITPMPPWRAIAMAIRCSVTVSMGLETIGVCNAIFLVNIDAKPTSCTPKVMCPGSRMRSS